MGGSVCFSYVLITSTGNGTRVIKVYHGARAGQEMGIYVATVITEIFDRNAHSSSHCAAQFPQEENVVNVA